MIRLLGNIPKDIVIACSGGPDSMAVLDFLKNSSRKIRIVHIDHGTKHAAYAKEFIKQYASEKCIDIDIHKIEEKIPKGVSPEAWWSKERYKVFHRYNLPIITGHNLNDVAEWWMFTSMRGNPKITPYRNRNVIRPFLTTEKGKLESWCNYNDVPYVIDPTNAGDEHARSLIRKNIIPEVLKVNPGFLKTIRKKVNINYQEELNV